MEHKVYTDLRLLTAVYVEVLALMCAFVVYYRLEWPSHLKDIVTSGIWIMFLLSVSLSVIAAFLIRNRYRRDHPSVKTSHLTVALGLVSLLVVFLCSEAVVRIMTTATPEGAAVGDIMLLPREWSKVMLNKRLIWDEFSSRHGVFVFDEMLGWTVGNNRHGTGPHGEAYFSSVEGLRVGSSGLSLVGSSSKMIALLGDSYTFGQDVNYEDSWGYRLERKLRDGTRVLNFGVPGYGIDQAYLRYERDVRRWKPAVVLLAFISHDLMRSTMVYYQIGFPGAHVPGAKPRLTIQNGRLVPINLPLPRPESLLQSGYITDLPFVDYDRTYRAADWTWHLYQVSYLLRFAVTWNSGQQGLLINEETRSLNTLVFQTFARRVREDGSIPIIVFLPSFTDYRDAAGQPIDSNWPPLRILVESGVDYINASPCLNSISRDQTAFTTGWHYTPAANELIAECLHAALRQKIPWLDSAL